MKYVADSLSHVSKTKAFDVRVLYTLAQLESNFNPFKITMVVPSALAKKLYKSQTQRIKVVEHKYEANSTLKRVDFFPENLALAKSLAKTFKQQKLLFNAGLMQINSEKLDLIEIDSIFEPQYNLAKGIQSLDTCRRNFEKNHEIIECYKWGKQLKKDFPYYKAFIKQFNHNFGEN
jgi:type IV secretion system protein VirB1